MPLPSKPRIPFRNQILTQLPDSDRDVLLANTRTTLLPVGDTVARVSDAMWSVYLPETGVLSLVSEMTTGHQVGVGTVGREGIVGLETLFGGTQYPYRVLVLAESSGYQISTERFLRMYHRSEALRRLMILHLGYRISELMISAACNRLHSHRQRLACWLLVATDKAGHCSLHVTHDTMAQLVGGPRHAVTVALNELRSKGAISHLRGQLDIIERPLLVEHACECYDLHSRTGRSKTSRS